MIDETVFTTQDAVSVVEAGAAGAINATLGTSGALALADIVHHRARSEPRL